MNQPSLWERLAERQQSAARPAPKKDGVAQVAQAAQESASARLIGRRYKLGNRIGHGRFGAIYAATDQGRRDLGVEARVAVQLIDERFANDARMAAELTSIYSMLSASAHPNIVRTLELGRDGRTLFLVTELLEGLSLDAVLDAVAPEPLPFDEVAAVLLAVGDALRNLHAKGYVYGQLKPKNVFVTFQYGIKLLDVAPVSPPVSMPYYVEDMGKQLVARHTSDDVFELACLAYEMLSGRHPFNGNSPLEAQRVGLEPLPLTNVEPRRWDAIARALSLQRATRTATVQRFLDELALSGQERIRAGESAPRTASVRPAPPVGRSRPHSQGHGGELDVFDTLPLEPMPRRRSSAATLARSLFSIAVVVTLGGFAGLYYSDLRDSAADLLAIVDQKRLPQRPATGADAATDAPQTVAPANSPSRPESALPATSPPEPSRAPATAPEASSSAATGSATPRSSPPAASSAATPQSSAPAAPQSSSPTSLPPARASSAPPTVSPASTPSSTARSTAPPASERSGPTNVAEPGAGSLSASNVQPSVTPQPQAVTPPAATRPASEGEPSSPPTGARSSEASASPAARAEEPASQRASSPAPAKTAQPASAEFPFAFAAPTMTVSETGKMVRVEVRRTGPADKPGSVVWWLGSATASENDDYGKLGQHTERFEAGEETRTIFIPLINDSDPERTESFYIYLGRYSPQRQHLDALASLRIDIVDDD